MNLKDKTLFITGASRGIGLAIAKRAARDGANIVIAAKTAEANPKLPGTIHSAAAEIEAAGGKALPLQTDIRDEASVLAAVEQAVDLDVATGCHGKDVGLPWAPSVAAGPNPVAPGRQALEPIVAPLVGRVVVGHGPVQPQ